MLAEGDRHACYPDIRCTLWRDPKERIYASLRIPVRGCKHGDPGRADRDNETDSC